MRAQRLNRVVVPRQFCLRQRGVDFIVTDLVQQHDGPAFAAFEPWDQVMPALARLRRDQAAAKRADRVVILSLAQGTAAAR